jgi:hypothetical protein
MAWIWTGTPAGRASPNSDTGTYEWNSRLVAAPVVPGLRMWG